MPQNSTKKNKKPIERKDRKPPIRIIDEYFDMFHFKQVPVSEGFIDRLFSDLVKEAYNDKEMLTLEDFYLKRGLSPDSYYKWVKKYPQAQRAHDVALLAIGNRRERGGLTRKYDSGLVSQSMAHYSKRWKQGIEWRESLKQKENDKGGNITVVMAPFDDDTLTKSESVTLRSSKSPEEVAREVKRRTIVPKQF